MTVDTTVDGNDGECLVDCTIREAVATAAPGATVVVPAGTYTVSLGAIVLDRNLAIIGDGAQHTIIQGAVTPRRVFIVAVGVSVEIAGVTVSLDPVQGNGGGGIGNGGDLLLRECWLRDGFLTHQCCGGALHNTSSGTVTVKRCTMSNNSAEFAGAILNEGLMVIEDTTISGNSNAFEAGGILAAGSLTLSGSTVVGNVAAVAGAGNISGAFVIRNSVISDGVGGPDCLGVIDATAGYNLDGDGTCVASGGPGNLTAAADLGPLADNGGPVPTHAPAPDSPLIDAGNPAAPGSGGETCSAIDARGVARPQGAACDIGAFELAIGQDCPGGAADDADGDGVCAADDNCPGGFNPGQDAVVFPHSVVASASDRFSWAEPEDVSFVRGDLDQVELYATNDAGDLANTDSLVDSESPLPGLGFHYLVRLGGECTVGSWQTRLGGEPDRDQTLP